jgi:hypothetical protein
MEKMKGPFNGWPYHSKLFDTGTGQRYCQDAPIVLRCFRLNSLQNVFLSITPHYYVII